jgi:hypothetical protein
MANSSNSEKKNPDEKRQKSRCRRWHGYLIISIAIGSCLLALLVGPLWSLIVDQSISDDRTTTTDTGRHTWRRTRPDADIQVTSGTVSLNIFAK